MVAEGRAQRHTRIVRPHSPSTPKGSQPSGIPQDAATAKNAAGVSLRSRPGQSLPTLWVGTYSERPDLNPARGASTLRVEC